MSVYTLKLSPSRWEKSERKQNKLCHIHHNLTVLLSAFILPSAPSGRMSAEETWVGGRGRSGIVTSSISCKHKKRKEGSSSTWTMITMMPLLTKSLATDWTTHNCQGFKPLTRGFLLAKKLAIIGLLHFSLAKSCCTALGGRALWGSSSSKSSRLLLFSQLVLNTNYFWSCIFLTTFSIANILCVCTCHVWLDKDTSWIVCSSFSYKYEQHYNRVIWNNMSHVHCYC